MNNHSGINKKTLDNGLTILVRELHHIPKVAVQMWYNVGSKDELLGEKGIAHLIEHMIFKGTDILSESDIDTLVRKLSGTCNAFTYYDYTGFLFDFPKHHWREALPVIASCMTDCSFKEEMLNSEMKTVIQELKLSRDNYSRSLLKEMISAIFADHPYHYPVLGYKQDLWTVSAKDLYAFYKKHYKPNNATLVIVGDVVAEEAFALAANYFSHIPKDAHYQKKEHFFHKDIAATSVTLYRDITQPIIHYMFTVPGAQQKQETALGILEWIIGKGKSSRLYKKLVNSTQLATNVLTGHWNLVDHGVFFIIIYPKNSDSITEIDNIIQTEFEYLSSYGIQDNELERGYNNVCMGHYNFFENFEYQASCLGQSFLATGDEHHMLTMLNKPLAHLKHQINDLVKYYFRPTVMHKGYVLPLPSTEKKQWALLQEQSDAEDTAILAKRTRSTSIEPPSYANTIQIQIPSKFMFTQPQQYTVSNGLKVFYYREATTPQVTIVLEFKVSSYDDPEDKHGLYNFVMRMITEGTKKYTSEYLAETLENNGMALDISHNGIILTMLHKDFAYGLELLAEIVTDATFPTQEIEKVREQIIAEIKQYWDNPSSFVHQLARQEIYKNHPYSKQKLGTQESVSMITRQDLCDFYKKHIVPSNAQMAIVGGFCEDTINNTLESIFYAWNGTHCENKIIPAVITPQNVEINYSFNRDQVVLGFAQHSISRIHPDYDKYLLFDQIFGGGFLGSMGSRLFDLREETGLFYTIKGSLLVDTNEQAGMFFITTVVSLDRLAEAEAAIKKTIDTVLETLTEEDLDTAKRAVSSSLIDEFTTQYSTAQAILLLDKYSLPMDYFNALPIKLNTITLDEVKAAVHPMLNVNNLITIRVGRV